MGGTELSQHEELQYTGGGKQMRKVYPRAGTEAGTCRKHLLALHTQPSPHLAGTAATQAPAMGASAPLSAHEGQGACRAGRDGREPTPAEKRRGAAGCRPLLETYVELHLLTVRFSIALLLVMCCLTRLAA